MTRRCPSRASFELATLLSDRGARSAFARELGVSPQYISDWTTAYRQPPVRWMVAIQKRLGIPVDDWLMPPLRKWSPVRANERGAA